MARRRSCWLELGTGGDVAPVLLSPGGLMRPNVGSYVRARYGEERSPWGGGQAAHIQK